MLRREKPAEGIDAIVCAIAGSFARRGGIVREFHKRALKIKKLQSSAREKGELWLKNQLEELRQQIRLSKNRNEKLEDDCLACLGECARRSLGLDPYPCQIVGALALMNGGLGEMATGEGKTLTLALACVMEAWKNHPVHVVTANDYLARRDAEKLSDFYRLCGLRSAAVQDAMRSEERQRAYAASVTYTTSRELVADFLRDRLRLRRFHDEHRRHLARLTGSLPANSADTVLRGVHSVMIDEADHVLVDEALTPLILSQPRPDPLLSELSEEAWKIASQMEEKKHYKKQLAVKSITLTAEGESFVHAGERCHSIFKSDKWSRSLVRDALRVREFFNRGQEYIVRDGIIAIVDPSTGRTLHQRSWGQGIHQLVECKEGLEPTPQTTTLSSISFQRFFRMVPKLAGITGTAWENREEFWRIYSLPVLRIPRNKPLKLNRYRDRFFQTRRQKWEAVVREVVKMRESGRPVLIGTISVTDSEELSEMLRREGVEHELLNAVHHEKEAGIIASAGEIGRVTIATNMAGRGTDILTPDKTLERGGLHVIAASRNSSGRIDRQLYGRTARQGNPGSVSAFSSLDEDVYSTALPSPILRIFKTLGGKYFPGRQVLLTLLTRFCQWNLSKSGLNRRASILRQDQWTRESLPDTNISGT